MSGRGIAGRAPHLVLGGALSLALTLAVAVLSARPEWQSAPPVGALLRLSFAHSGLRNCRDRTAAELAALAKNMRTAEICDRRRAPVRVEMDVDGAPALAVDLAPSGLAGSGPSRIYKRIALAAGRYGIDLRLADDPAAAGFSHAAHFDITLEPGQSMAIDFDAASGGFFLH